MNTRKKLLLSLITVGWLGAIASVSVFGLFSATTQNAGNEISTGTVALTDNDAGQAMFAVSNASPGDSATKCIKVSFSGSLESDVHLYSQSTIGPLAQYVDLTITQGTQATPAFPGCTGFTPDATGVIFNGTLQSFEQTHNSNATGVDADPVGLPDWTTGTSMVFQFDETLQPGTPDSGQASSTGVHSFTWEARNN